MRLRNLAVLLIAALCFAPPCWAQGEKRVALIIGNDDYHSLKTLDNAVNDARLMERELKAAGFETVVKTNATRHEMNAAINAFADRIGKGATGLFYYAGHGVENQGQNYLIPIDAELETPRDLDDNAITMEKVTRVMKEADDRLNIIVLDACRDNPMKTRSGSRGLAVLPSGTGASGLIVAYAAAPGEKAEDGGKGGNGVFTQALAKALEEPGLKLEDVFSKASKAVSQRTGGRQTPYLTLANLPDGFYFHPPVAGNVPAATPALAVIPNSAPQMDSISLEAIFWQSAEKAGTLAAYEAYVKRYPHGQFIDLAKAKLDELKPKAKVEAASVVTTPAPAAVVHREEPRAEERRPGSVFRDAPGLPEMVVIPTGRFTMGSSSAETSREGVPDADANWEHPQHEVSIRSFGMGKYDVTFAEWDACVADGGCNGYRPRDQGWGRGNRPVMNVSYEDAQAYVRWLNGKAGSSVSVSTGSGDGPYRLPSEAEWEYAARAGTTTARWWGEEVGYGNAVCDGCGSQWDNKSTAPVGSFRPNPYGLYDVLGNVEQWTDDCWAESYAGAPADGRANISGDCGMRVVRGGSWNYIPRSLRSALRYWFGSGFRNFYIGFRVARTLP